MKRRQLIIGYAFAAIGAALFSSKAIFIKLAYLEKADAVLMLALRMAFALPFFAAVGLLAWRARRATGVPLPGFALILRALLSGFIGYYLAMILDFEGLILISAQLERLVLFTNPVFVMLLGAAFFGSRLSWQGLGAAAVTYLGPICRLSTSRQGHHCHHRSFVLLAAATGIFAPVLPSFLVNAVLARIGPQSTAMILTLSPLLTIYFAVLLLGEPFTLFEGIGTALVLGGIGFYTWDELRTSRRIT